MRGAPGELNDEGFFWQILYRDVGGIERPQRSATSRCNVHGKVAGDGVKFE
jgi:hypothetical protein